DRGGWGGGKELLGRCREGGREGRLARAEKGNRHAGRRPGNPRRRTGTARQRVRELIGIQSCRKPTVHVRGVRQRAQPGTPPAFRSPSSRSLNYCLRDSITFFLASIFVVPSLLLARACCSSRGFCGSE